MVGIVPYYYIHFLGKEYKYSVLNKQGITKDEIDYLFDPKKIIKIHSNIAFPDERHNAIIDCGKNCRLTIFTFYPFIKGKKLNKVGIVTAFKT